MSTKATVAYGDNFHLYRECLDEDNIYLELDGVELTVSRGSVMVQIPLEIWEVIRRRGAPDLSQVDLTDEAIEQEAKRFVQWRLDQVKEAKEKWPNNPKEPLAGIFGMLDYGTVDEPVEQQIANGVEAMKATRLRQQVLRDKIKALEEKQR